MNVRETLSSTRPNLVLKIRYQMKIRRQASLNTEIESLINNGHLRGEDSDAMLTFNRKSRSPYQNAWKEGGFIAGSAIYSLLIGVGRRVWYESLSW